MSDIKKLNLEFIKEHKNSLYICAAGFEDRALAIVERLRDTKDKFFKYSLIIEYSPHALHKDDNKPKLKVLQDKLPQISQNLLKNITFDIEDIYQSKSSIIDTFKTIPKEDIETVFIDISGMANSLILLTIHQAKKIFLGKEIMMLYAEADIYYPTLDKKEEILRLMESEDEKDILKLGDELGASGRRDIIILPDFKGYFTENKPICLIFFVGYEPSRAAGLLDSYRPNMVIVYYGKSPHKKFEWRTEFSKKLHINLFKEFGHVEKYISTFYISEIVTELDKVYKSTDDKGNNLYDFYNIAITPQCSKLQAVASYLFSQMHPDVQIVFCFPGKFNPERYSKGIGELWVYKL